MEEPDFPSATFVPPKKNRSLWAPELLTHFGEPAGPRLGRIHPGMKLAHRGVQRSPGRRQLLPSSERAESRRRKAEIRWRPLKDGASLPTASSWSLFVCCSFLCQCFIKCVQNRCCVYVVFDIYIYIASLLNMGFPF